MSDRTVLLQYVTNQRTERPKGLRIWSDGLVQRPADDNPPPGESDLLEKDREVKWQDERTISAEQVGAIKTTIDQVGFFNLEPRLLINYCKDDPGTMIWTVTLDGRTWRVVVYDPRPKRSAALDQLSQRLNDILKS